MMRKVLSPIVIASVLSSCSHTPMTPPVVEVSKFQEQNPEVSRAIAQSRGRRRPDYRGKYDGPPPPFRRDQWERRPNRSNFCQKYINDSAKHALTCAAGAEEGAKMATWIAGNHGKEDGYMRGFAWGLNQSAYFYQNSPEEIRRGELNAQSLDNHLYKARDEGRVAGTNDGTNIGTNEAKNKFYRAVDTNVMPTPDYKLPPTNFIPTQNAYAKYIAPIPTVSDILKRDRFGRMRFYDSHDRLYGGGVNWREQQSRDLWSHDGVYKHNHEEWVNGPRMFEYYIQRIPAGQKRYNDLKYVTMNEGSAERLPAQETRPQRPPREREGDRPGAPTNPPVPPVAPVTPVTPVVPPVTPPTPVYVDYQAIFKEAFIDAYSLNAQDAYSREYWRMIDDGQSDGEELGAEIGIEIAYHKGMSLGFNRNFSAASADSYNLNFAKSFGESHQQTFNYYRNNAVLSLNFQNVVGLVDDGVIQPGEELSVRFKVTNYGGVQSPLSYSLQGDVQDAKTLADSIKPISTKLITSPHIGDVLNTLDNGADARYVLSVNGMQENLMQQIKRPLQLQNVKSNLSEIDGTGIFNLTLTNIATVELNGTISIELLIDGVVRKSIVADPMKPSEVRNYSLDFQKQDPINWIEKGHKSEILVKYNNVVFAKSAQNLMVSNQMASFAAYFIKLINEKGFIPDGKSPESRLKEVKDKIIAVNKSEVANNKDASGNVYRTDPSQTIPGKILDAKNATQEMGPRAGGELSSLTDAFNKESGQFKTVLGIGPKRSAYKFLLNAISGKSY